MLASIAFCVWGCVAVGAHAVVAANGRNAFARYRRVDGRGRVSAFPFPAADSLPAQQLVQITSNRTDEGQGGPFGRYMVMIKNKDYRGNDIRSIGGVKSQEECARKCFEHGSCKAMSYDNRWGRHRCWIKRTNKNLRVLMNVFTGFMSNECKGGDYCVDRFEGRQYMVMFHSQDYRGAPFGRVVTANADQCASHCLNDQRCTAFTFNPDTGNSCWLKSTPGSRAKLNWAGVYTGFPSGGCKMGGGDFCIDRESGRRFNAVMKEGTYMVMYENTDFYGNDIKGFNTDSAASCAYACFKHPGCKAMSWVTDGRKICLLKSKPATRKGHRHRYSGEISSACPSGRFCYEKQGFESPPESLPQNAPQIQRYGKGPFMVMFQRKDYWGNDIKSFHAQSMEACAKACFETKGCGAIAWNIGGRNCWLKTKAANFRHNHWRASGFISDLCNKGDFCIEKDPGKNIALGKTASASGSWRGTTPNFGIDGNSFGRHPVMHSRTGCGPHWWQVDLGKDYPVGKIIVYNRYDCCDNRADGIQFWIGDNPRTKTGNELCGTLKGTKWLYVLWCNITGRYVYVAHTKHCTHINIAEIQVYEQQPLPPANSLSPEMDFFSGENRLQRALM